MKSIIPDIEKESLSEQKKFQEKLLSEQLSYISTHSKFYSELLVKHKIDITKINSIEDLSFLPTTSKADLQIRNKDFFCTNDADIIDYSTTSGTSGEPVIIPQTERDLKRLAYNEYLSLSCAGITKDDIVQIMTTIDRRFMAGLAYFIGLRQIGASIIRAGAGTPAFQWKTIKLINPSYAVSVPSFILKLIEYAQNNGIEYKDSSLKKFVCIGDNINNQDFSLNSLGTRIKTLWDVELYSTYASSEMSAAFTECEYHIGGHHHPELIITEFLDEEDNSVEEGEPGELTITNLGIEGMPLLRFRTGDICTFHSEPCKCGRKTIRLGPVIGRKNQMIKTKGTTIYPPALYDILDSFQEVSNYIISVQKNDVELDEINVNIGVESYKTIHIEQIKDHFRSKLRLVPKFVINTPDKVNEILLEHSGTKEKKFIDLR